jgi:hypothetical protein
VLSVLAFLGVFGALGHGGAGADLVSLLPTEAYFQSRRIPLNIENFLDLASTDPKDGKAQIFQLMALRALAEKPELIGKDATALRTIEKIANGEIARDRLGFSQDYARRTLLALGRKITQPKAAQPADFRAEALGWFPASATLVGFLGGPLTDSTGDQGNELRRLLMKLQGRPRDVNRLFDDIEAIGNVRIDRIGFAYAADAQNKQKDRFYVRITGKGDLQRLVAALKTSNGERATWKEEKDAKGMRITTIEEGNSPAGAFIGDTDILLAGYVVGRADGKDPANHLDVIHRFLAVRAGKEKSVLKGALQDRLPKLAPETVGLLVGDLPDVLGTEVFTKAKLRAPKSVRVEALRAKGSMHIRFQAKLENSEEAKSFVESLVGLRPAGRDALKKLEEMKNATPVLHSTVAALRKTLESVHLQADGNGIKGTVSVPAEALLAPLWLQLGTSAGASQAEPEPPPPPEIRRGQKETRLVPELARSSA